MNQKLIKIVELLYLIIGVFVVVEFIFYRGMFTWLLAVISICLAGIVVIILKLKEKEFLQSALYLLCTVALCMGYFAILP